MLLPPAYLTQPTWPILFPWIFRGRHEYFEHYKIGGAFRDRCLAVQIQWRERNEYLLGFPVENPHPISDPFAIKLFMITCRKSRYGLLEQQRTSDAPPGLKLLL
ncbi:hypothetical protein ACTXT7_008061 [Hymenolepis weldensis]